MSMPLCVHPYRSAGAAEGRAGEPAYVRRFCARLLTRGARWEAFVLARPSGWARGVRLRPPGRVRGRLLVFHGAGNDPWFPHLELYDQVVAAGWEVVAPPLDGHGRGSTTRLDPAALPSLVPQAVAAASALRPAVPLALVGYSLGGAVLVQGLPMVPPAGVVGAVGLGVPARLRARATALWLETLDVLTHPRTLAAALRRCGLAGLPPAVGPFLRRRYPLRLAQPPRSRWRRRLGLGYLEALARFWDEVFRPRPARVPLRLVVGGRDRFAPPADAAAIAAATGAEVEPWPHHGHFRLALDPAVAAALLRWAEDAAG